MELEQGSSQLTAAPGDWSTLGESVYLQRWKRAPKAVHSHGAHQTFSQLGGALVGEEVIAVD